MSYESIDDSNSKLQKKYVRRYSWMICLNNKKLVPKMYDFLRNNL